MRKTQIRVVLVRTLFESNIGAASRAMANMGCQDMILIGRQCELTFAAQQAAATGQYAWQNRREYADWSEYFAEEPKGLRIAFSARDGRERPVRDWAETLRWLQNEHPDFQGAQASVLPIDLIFGPEDWGLSNDDLAQAHFVANIPTFGDNSSLNLAQAVLLALFVLRTQWQELPKTILDGQQPLRPTGAEFPVFPDQTLHRWLTEMGFDLQKPLNAFSVLKRMMLHNVPTQKEIEMLETVLQQSIRKLAEYNRLRGLK